MSCIIVVHFVFILITCKPALAERETALALAFPESLPALPPAYDGQTRV